MSITIHDRGRLHGSGGKEVSEPFILYSFGLRL